MIAPGSSWRQSLALAAVFCLAVLLVTAAVTATSDSSGTVPDIRAPGGGSIDLEIIEGERAKVRSDYWRVEFDLDNGGVLDTIVYPHGSGKNLLLEPLHTYVDQWGDRNAPATELRSSRDGDVIRLEFAGQMATAGRAAGPVSFHTTWTLSPFVVRADHRIRFHGDLMVSKVGVGSTTVRRELDEFGVRVGPVDDPDIRKRALVRLGKVQESGTQLIKKRHAPIYLLFFDRGVEGFDLTTASDLATWATGLTGRDGAGHYEARLADNSSGIRISREPLRVARPAKVSKGEYTFSYYLGLLRVMEKSNRKWRHLSFGNHPWPSDEEIRRWADNGVNIVRLHNDYADDGNFWHDGAWPPYDERGMGEVRRVIATCHRHNILVVPYFSIYEFHPEAQGYREHEQEWKRTTDQLGTVIHNYIRKGEFGAQMCPQSGWLERRKRDVEQAYRELGFDGIYYDWTRCMPCNNKHHNPELHLATDQVVDLLAWTRRLIAPNGVLILHMPGNTPCITMENFADLVVNMEELSNAETMLRLADVPLVTLYAESIPRSPCPSYRQDRPRERNQNNIAHLIVLGMFPWSGATGGEVYEDTLKLFRAFKSYQLEKYRLHSALCGAVRTGWKEVYGAVYSSSRDALVALSNTSSEKRKNVVWRIKPEALGLGTPARLQLTDTKTGKRQTVALKQLDDGTLRTDLEGYEYRVIEIRPVR